MNNIFKLVLRTRALQRPTTLVTPALRMVHARGYNEYYDNWSFRFHEVNFALGSSKTTASFAFVFRKYGQYMTDYQIAYAFYMIGKNQLERSPDFWDLILPAVKTQLAKLDRNCVKSLTHIIEGAASMTLQDNEFWELVEQKLVDEGLHRYLDL